MGSDNLQDVRENIQNSIPQAWTTDDAADFARDLQSAFGQDLEDAYEECATSQGQSLTDCLDEQADEDDLSGEFRDQWASARGNDDLESLFNALRAVRNAWDSEARADIREIALDADMDQAGSLCADAEYQDVQDEFGLDSAPATFAECMELVSDAQDLSSELKEAWGTNGA